MFEKIKKLKCKITKDQNSQKGIDLNIFLFNKHKLTF